ncbi:MAG: LysR family transcriptional regulator [Paracoccaceae bacterium]
MRPSLKQLEALIWVADLGSFRKAADRLNTTQPNISARISGLETVLGVSLMERDAGSVHLTTKGLDVLDHARKVLNATEALVNSASEAALFDGTLRLGVTEMIVHTWLPDFLRDLKTRFPTVQVEMTVDMSVHLETQLAGRSLDLALQNGPFNRAMSGQVSLGSYPLIWVTSPSLNLHRLNPINIEDLARHTILTHTRDTKLYAEVSGHFSTRRDLQVRLVPSSSLTACLHMAVNGMGLVTVPAAMVERELASGDLVRLQYDWVPDAMDFYARYDAKKASDFVATAAGLAARCAAASF